MYPEQILVAVAEAYAEGSTYRDAGQVTTMFHYPDGRARTTVRPFTTAFARPDRFRFEYRHRFDDAGAWNRYIVWANGSELRTWWDVRPGAERPASLELALAAAAGVAGGSAHTVPALLMPGGLGGQRLTELAELASLGDEPLGESTCYRLSGRFPSELVGPAERERRYQELLAKAGRMERSERSPTTVWIDRGTLLIRRVEWATQFETFRTETVTDYNPGIGVLLSDDELRFGAPETAEPVAAPDPAT
jgi:hypothetical protein